MNRNLSLSVGLAVALLTFGTQAGGNDAPLHYKNKDTVFVLHKGRGPVSISVGYNDIDQPRNVSCRTAKCVILIDSVFEVNAAGAWVCPFVDGKSALPKCKNHFDLGYPYSRQFAEVSQGTHTVQTKVYSDNPGTVGNWEVDYTVYDAEAVQ